MAIIFRSIWCYNQSLKAKLEKENAENEDEEKKIEQVCCNNFFVKFKNFARIPRVRFFYYTVKKSFYLKSYSLTILISCFF